MAGAGLDDASQEEIKDRYDHTIGSIMFGGSLSDDLCQLEFVKQGQRDTALVWQAMDDLSSP